MVVIGRVVGIPFDDELISDGMVNISAVQPISRLGYFDYAVAGPDTIFSIERPKVAEDGSVIAPEAAE